MLFILDGKTERGSHTHTHYETREKTSKKKKKGRITADSRRFHFKTIMQNLLVHK